MMGLLPGVDGCAAFTTVMIFSTIPTFISFFINLIYLIIILDFLFFLYS